MTEDVADQLRSILTTTQNLIDSLHGLNLADTAGIFALAKLDLQTKIHGISDQELLAFSNALRTACDEVPQAEIIDLSTRVSRKA